MRKHHLRTTRNKTSRKLDYILLGVILLVAAVLRLWKLGQVPFTHEEFGNTCWLRLMEWSEFWAKFPFALMGIGSIALVYFIGKQWFNSKTGLLAAAFFAVSQLTVFYSQLAVSFTAGLFFLLLMTFFWSKVLFGSKDPSVALCLGMAVSAWLAAIILPFLAILAALIFVSGFFFLKKERRLAYGLGCLDALLLYLPFALHRSATKPWGVSLAKPEFSFLTDFLQYSMNHAPLFIFAVGFLIILPFILQKPEKRCRPLRWAAIAWFVIVFFIHGNLGLCYPFLILAVFSWYKNNTMTKTQTGVVVAAILFIGSMSLVINRRHYDLMYHQGYDQIAQRMQDDAKNYPDIRFATATLDASCSEFYQAQTPVANRKIFETYGGTGDLYQWFKEDDSQMLGFGWTDNIPAIWEALAVARYPWRVREDVWQASKYLTLSKDSIPSATNLLHPLNEEPFYFNNTEWGVAHCIYGDSLDSDIDLLGVACTIQATDTVTDCILVMEVHDAQTDSILMWLGTGTNSSMLLPGQNILANGVRFDPKKDPIRGKIIKTYLWNSKKGTMIVTRFDYYYTKYNKRLNGLYRPL